MKRRDRNIVELHVPTHRLLEELNVCLTCFYTRARKKDGTYYKNSSMKFIEEPLLIVSFTHSSTANLDVTEFLKISKTDG